MDQPKIERLLRLMALMSGNVDYTVEELASRLETSYRSIYRYIETFKRVTKAGNAPNRRVRAGTGSVWAADTNVASVKRPSARACSSRFIRLTRS